MKKYRLIFGFLFFSFYMLRGQEQIPVDSFGFIEPINISPNLKKLFKKLNYLRVNKTVIPGDSIVKIIHFGDSHIQGDHFSGSIRRSLQGYFGNAGMGILFPYALAKSYGPAGINVTKNGKWEGSNILSGNPPKQYGISGYLAQTSDKEAWLGIKLNEKFDMNSFQRIRIWHTSDSSSFQFDLGNNFKPGLIKTFPSGTSVSTFFNLNLENNFMLSIHRTKENQNHFGLLGFELLQKENRGLDYFHCGVVGAQFIHLTDNALLSLEQIIYEKPDLVVFSYGTNEAYNRNLDTANYRIRIEKFIQNIKDSIPDVAIILSNAPDTRSQGKTPPHQTDVNNVLKKIAEKLNLSFFDLHKTMGGWGSLHAWYKNNLTLKDKLHFTREGYALQANLFVLAFLKAYNNSNSQSEKLDERKIKNNIKPYLNLLIGISDIEIPDTTGKTINIEHQGESLKPPLKKKKSKSKNPKLSPRIHTVRKGENLYSIGKKYKVSYQSIARTNHLNINRPLQPGQKLTIPAK